MVNNLNTLRFKVLFLASWFPNRNSQVLGVFVRRKALAMTRLCNVSVLYVSADPSMRNKTFEVDCRIEDGLLIVRVYFRYFLSGIIRKILYNFSFLIAHYIGWKRIKKEWGNPDLIHVNVIDRSGYIALILKYLKKIKYVITEHSTPDIDYLRGLTKKTKIPLKFLKKLVIINSEYINVDSQASLDYYKKVGFKGNFGIIKNVVEIKPEFLIPSKRYKKDNIKRAVHISILNGRKNVADIINAFDHICNKLNRKELELHLIGDGEQKNQLENLADKLKLLNKNIFFHGFVNENKKLEILINSDFHILNSDEEGFSVVTAESILYGIPVIATRCGGPEDFVPKEVGILIERRNLKELIDAIIYMMDNSQYYVPSVLQEFGKNNFSPEIICNDTYKVYKQVITKWRAGNTSYIVNINPDWVVLDVGSGHQPNRRANVILEKYLGETIHRTNQIVKTPTDKQLIVGDALSMPFKNKEFDFVIASHIGEHIDDPVKFCSELKRVAKNGYIETPGPLTEFFLPSIAHKWIVKRKGNIIYFKKNHRVKPFSKLFYSIFYLNGDGNDFGTIKSNSLILKVFNFLMVKIWIFLPFTYMRIVWNEELSVKVIDE